MKRQALIETGLDFPRKKHKKEKPETIILDEQEEQEEQKELIRFTDPKEPEKEKVSRSRAAPWMTKKTRDIRDSLLRFHNEIIEFTEYVCPTRSEHQVRENALKELSGIVRGAIGECQVHAFGSFATGLYLPDGDIDVAVLIDTDDVKKVYDIIHTTIRSRSDKYCDIDYIRKSKVPLIKFHTVQDDIQFDISVNKEDGIKQIVEVRRMLDQFPEFRYMAMVLKCTLKVRNLGETYSGGLGSFLLFCMLLTYLRDIHRKGKYYTLSEHLLRFMEFYSITHDWQKRRVYVSNGVIEERRGEDHALSFMSPQDTTHDIGKSAFKIKDVLGVFRNRFRLILGKNFGRGESVLKELVNPSEVDFMYLKANY